MNEWSDHTPISFSLCSCKPGISQEDFIEIKCKWNEDYKSPFRSSIIEKLPYFNSIVSRIDVSKHETISIAINEFTSCVREIADPLFLKRFQLNTCSETPKKNDWFDAECQSARAKYFDSLRSFNLSHSEEHRVVLCENKTVYKKIVRKKKWLFKRKKLTELEGLKLKKPREFWKYFKKSSPNSANSISLDEFHKYFSTLEQEINSAENSDAETFCSNYNFDNPLDSNDDLDFPITINEVISAVKKLKTGKSHGADNILNEYLIETVDILGSHLCDLFNSILESGVFPESWTEGIVIPIFKKGDKMDCGNYRGITLLSCFSKLFTVILNQRLMSYCAVNGKISDAHFGFKKGSSTVDAVFVLYSLIEHFINHNKRLYVAFVDLKKCFDSINRNSLLYKLFKQGFQGKILRVIKSMYENVKSRVKHCGNMSEIFEYSLGLRQGEIMSPVLVSLFLEDLELSLSNRRNAGLSINDIYIMLLLFADDMVLFGESPRDLQNSLDSLLDYCNLWGLEVNSTKTKIMVIRKRGHIRDIEKWSVYDGNVLDIVDQFNYLGTVLSFNGSFSCNNEYLVGKGLKAVNVLLKNCNKYPLKPKSLCQLFDSFVGSILSYACELWGFSKAKGIELVHLQFCKRILKVRTSTCSAGVYGELARYPLYVMRYYRIINYWGKVVSSNNIILSNVYKLSLEDCNHGYKNWVHRVKNLLDNYGFSHVFYNPNPIYLEKFPRIFKQRVIDCFIQDWYRSIESSAALEEYKHFKNHFGYEPYLDILSNNYRFFLTRMRLSSHSLRIQTGRYGRNKIPRNERICQCCNTNDIEDVFHFICICPSYDRLRKKYLDKKYYVRPSVFKFNQLMNSDDGKQLLTLSRFIKNALDIRKNILNLYV